MPDGDRDTRPEPTLGPAALTFRFRTLRFHEQRVANELSTTNTSGTFDPRKGRVDSSVPGKTAPVVAGTPETRKLSRKES
jgi:hypothetical protein